MDGWKMPENCLWLFLVEIRLKDWVASLADFPSRIVAFEEVLAYDDYTARHLGFESFENRLKRDAALREKLERNNLSLSTVCAPDAVPISRKT